MWCENVERRHIETIYEKPELPDARKVDAGSIENGYKNLANGIEGV